MQKCKKKGQFFKRLDKHLARAHPETTEGQHSALPGVEAKEASHMLYRVKEECGLCGKTLLLRPHLKKAHNVKTWDEYILKLKEKGTKKCQRRSAVEKETPSSGLYSLLTEIRTVAAAKRKTRSARTTEPTSSPPRSPATSNSPPRSPATSDSPPRSPEIVPVPYTENEFIRFCVHNTNLYMVLATHQAIKNGKKDPVNVLNYLSKNKLTVEFCRYIVDMDFIPKLYGYYRFAGYYPYPKEKCISCSLKSCSCGRLPRSFYTFCRRACNTIFNCTVCKNWGSGYHTCFDFFWCKVCNDLAKRYPLQVADF